MESGLGSPAANLRRKSKAAAYLQGAGATGGKACAGEAAQAVGASRRFFMSALKCRPPKHPLKDTCALSFFKGALLNDPKHILRTIGQGQAGRWIKFTSLKEIAATRTQEI